MKTSLLHPRAWSFFLTAFLAQANGAIAQQCPFSEPFSYADTVLLRQPGGTAYVFATSDIKIDADGAPNAYHPDDVQLDCTRGTGFKGLDCPANAGYGKRPSSWWPSALLPDPENTARPYIQPPVNEFAGFFVSQTSLKDLTKPSTDPARYVDARHVPYLVFPGNFHRMKGTGNMGDLGYAINLDNGKSSSFIVAEAGPTTASLGEMSIALGKALGGANPNPRTGAGKPSGTILVVMFPRSAARPSWPLSNKEIDARASKLLADIGGKERLSACIGPLRAR